MSNSEPKIDKSTTRSSTSIWGTQLIEDTRFVNYIPNECKESEHSPKTQKKSAENKNNPEDLTEKEFEYLKEVVLTPGKPCSYYDKELKMSATTTTKVRNSLIEKGYMRIEEMQLKKNGRTSKLNVPNPKAEQLIDRHHKQKRKI